MYLRPKDATEKAGPMDPRRTTIRLHSCSSCAKKSLVHYSYAVHHAARSAIHVIESRIAAPPGPQICPRHSKFFSAVFLTGVVRWGGLAVSLELPTPTSISYAPSANLCVGKPASSFCFFFSGRMKCLKRSARLSFKLCSRIPSRTSRLTRMAEPAIARKKGTGSNGMSL